jgi:hypothetical protein
MTEALRANPRFHEQPLRPLHRRLLRIISPSPRLAARTHAARLATTDPYELFNIYDSLSSTVQTRLHMQLHQLEHCHGPKSCEIAENLNQFP